MTFYQQKFKKALAPFQRELDQENPYADAIRERTARENQQFAAAAPGVGQGIGAAAGGLLGLIPGLQAAAPALVAGGSALGGGIATSIGNRHQQQADDLLDPIRKRELRRMALLESLRGMR